MKKDKPDIIIVLAWHLFKPIHEKWLKIGLKNLNLSNHYQDYLYKNDR